MEIRKTEFGTACKINYKGAKAEIRYTYECKKCGGSQYEYHSMSENPVVKCEECNSKDVFKVIVAPRFHLKGGGFPSKEHKIDQEIAEQDEAMREGFTCQSEIDTAKAMYAERDAQLVKDGRKPLSSIRERETVHERLEVSGAQFEAVEKQVAKASTPFEKHVMQKQLTQMEQKNGSIISRETTKKVGKKVLEKAAKSQSKLVGI